MSRRSAVLNHFCAAPIAPRHTLASIVWPTTTRLPILAAADLDLALTSTVPLSKFPIPKLSAVVSAQSYSMPTFMGTCATSSTTTGKEQYLPTGTLDPTSRRPRAVDHSRRPPRSTSGTLLRTRAERATSRRCALALDLTTLPVEHTLPSATILHCSMRWTIRRMISIRRPTGTLTSIPLIWPS